MITTYRAGAVEAALCDDAAWLKIYPAQLAARKVMRRDIKRNQPLQLSRTFKM